MHCTLQGRIFWNMPSRRHIDPTQISTSNNLGSWNIPWLVDSIYLWGLYPNLSMERKHGSSPSHLAAPKEFPDSWPDFWGMSPYRGFTYIDLEYMLGTSNGSEVPVGYSPWPCQGKGTLVNVSHRAAHGWVYAATVKHGEQASDPPSEGKVAATLVVWTVQNGGI